MRKVRIGLDFDGVVAYNPFRIVRAPIKWFKRKVLGIKKLSFFVPKNSVDKFVWTLIHESSIFPARGVALLKKEAVRQDVEFYLVTARFDFLRNNLLEWLDRNGLKTVFKEIVINDECEQPHIYKTRVVERLKLDYFVEDNLDIVTYLSAHVKTRVLWIYNFMDARHPYLKKFPYLEKALEDILK